eukprot:1141768-Pelagomonas_calceolata.AAC.1
MAPCSSTILPVHSASSFLPTAPIAHWQCGVEEQCDIALTLYSPFTLHLLSSHCTHCTLAMWSGRAVWHCSSTTLLSPSCIYSSFTAPTWHIALPLYSPSTPHFLFFTCTRMAHCSSTILSFHPAFTTRYLHPYGTLLFHYNRFLLRLASCSSLPPLKCPQEMLLRTCPSRITCWDMLLTCPEVMLLRTCPSGLACQDALSIPPGNASQYMPLRMSL